MKEFKPSSDSLHSLLQEYAPPEVASDLAAQVTTRWQQECEHSGATNIAEPTENILSRISKLWFWGTLSTAVSLGACIWMLNSPLFQSKSGPPKLASKHIPSSTARRSIQRLPKDPTQELILCASNGTLDCIHKARQVGLAIGLNQVQIPTYERTPTALSEQSFLNGTHTLRGN